MLNRSIIIIKVKEPFLNWLRSLPEPENEITLDEINFENTAYLLPEYEMDGEREKIRLAELHWYEAHGIGKKEIKRKKYLE